MSRFLTYRSWEKCILPHSPVVRPPAQINSMEDSIQRRTVPVLQTRVGQRHLTPGVPHNQIDHPHSPSTRPQGPLFREHSTSNVAKRGSYLLTNHSEVTVRLASVLSKQAKTWAKAGPAARNGSGLVLVNALARPAAALSLRTFCVTDDRNRRASADKDQATNHSGHCLCWLRCFLE